jgi:hypothetical protein
VRYSSVGPCATRTDDFSMLLEFSGAGRGGVGVDTDPEPTGTFCKADQRPTTKRVTLDKAPFQ